MKELLEELARLSESARKSHALARAQGDEELCAALSKLGWSVAELVARVGRRAHGIEERAS